jgi:hypothetical protein
MAERPMLAYTAGRDLKRSEHPVLSASFIVLWVSSPGPDENFPNLMGVKGISAN